MLAALRANNQYKKHKNQNEEPLQKKWPRLTPLSEFLYRIWRSRSGIITGVEVLEVH